MSEQLEDARTVSPHVPFGSTLRRTTGTTTIDRASVYLGNVNPGKVSSGFSDSLAQLTAAEVAYGWGCYVGKLAKRSRANISMARNLVVADFLATDGDWLLFVDSDTVFPPDTIVRLLAAAATVGTKIIGALCVMVDDDGVAPTLYQPAPDGGVTRLQLDYPDETILQVAATGAACLMVHREVLEAYRDAEQANSAWLDEHADDPLLAELRKRELLREPSPELGFFQERIRSGRWVSEDVEFCLRLIALGYKAYVDCTLPVGHQKHGRVWSVADIRQSVSLHKRPIGVVIPTKQRPDLLEPLLDQLAEQGEAIEIVIVDNGMDPMARASIAKQPTTTALDAPAVTILDGEDLGVNAMWNLGVEHLLARHGRSIHIAILNDDIRIGPGFLGALSRTLESDTKLAAVSANYDGRRRPGLVEHVTDICAGRMDGTGGFAGFAFMIPGVWFGGGYRFPSQCMWWFGDNDLVLAAQDSGARIGIALGAEVEHLDGGGQSAGDVNWSAHAEQLALDEAAFKKRWQTLTQSRLRAQLAARAHTPTEGARVCVMTTVMGGYDTPWPLLAQDIDCDAILITDDPTLEAPGWRTVHWLCDDVMSDEDGNEYVMPARLAAKRPRCRPDRFTDADIIVWLDGHLSVLNPHLIAELVEQLGDNPIGAFRHGFHTTISQEAELAATLPKYKGLDLKAQAAHYLDQGHPDDWGLWTTGVMVRRPAATIDFGDAWQAEIDQWGPEDQISLPYALRNAGLEMVDLPFEGWWVGRRFALHPHTADGTM